MRDGSRPADVLGLVADDTLAARAAEKAVAVAAGALDVADVGDAAGVGGVAGVGDVAGAGDAAGVGDAAGGAGDADGAGGGDATVLVDWQEDSLREHCECLLCRKTS